MSADTTQHFQPHQPSFLLLKKLFNRMNQTLSIHIERIGSHPGTTMLQPQGSYSFELFKFHDSP